MRSINASATAPVGVLRDAHPHGVMFHHFHDGAAHRPSQGSIDAATLRALLDFLGPERVVSAEEWTDRATAQALRPGDLCLTFDDALRCQLDVALPVLRERGLTAFWFVYTSVLAGVPEPLEIYRCFRSAAFASVDDFYAEFFAHASSGPRGAVVRERLDRFDPSTFLAEFPFYSDDDRRFRYLRDDVLGPVRYAEAMRVLMAGHDFDPAEVAGRLWMTDADLQRLAAERHVVGLHSHTHPTRLAELSDHEQRREYHANAEHLERVLGAAPTTVSHPCNSYGPSTLELLAALGVRLGFRANMSQREYSLLECPREDHALVVRRMQGR